MKKNPANTIGKNINIKMLTAPECSVNHVKVPTKEILHDLISEIKYFQVPFIKLIVRDNKEMMIAFCKVSDDTALPETAIAIWNQYPEFVETISELYEFIWNADFFNQAFDPFMDTLN